MKVPSWATAIGILMMLAGGCSVNSSLQSINSPKMLDMQKKMFDDFSKGLDAYQQDSIKNISEDSAASEQVKTPDQLIFENLGKNMIPLFEVSDFTKLWMVRFGYIGIFVWLLYILGGLFLLIIKPFSLKLTYTALGLGIIFNIIKYLVLTTDPSSGFLSMAAGMSQIFGIIVHIIFLIVIVSSDKTAYQPKIERI